MGELATRAPLDPVRTNSDRTVSDRTRALIAAAMPANTKRAYDRTWRQFGTWCAANDRTPLPATAETLAEYVTHLSADRGLSPATIEQAIACVRRVHREAGYEASPSRSPPSTSSRSIAGTGPTRDA